MNGLLDHNETISNSSKRRWFQKIPIRYGVIAGVLLSILFALLYMYMYSGMLNRSKEIFDNYIGRLILVVSAALPLMAFAIAILLGMVPNKEIPFKSRVLYIGVWVWVLILVLINMVYLTAFFNIIRLA